MLRSSFHASWMRHSDYVVSFNHIQISSQAEAQLLELPAAVVAAGMLRASIQKVRSLVLLGTEKYGDSNGRRLNPIDTVSSSIRIIHRFEHSYFSVSSRLCANSCRTGL